MIKANSLIQQQKKREDNKFITYNKILDIILKKITLASASNSYITTYEMPKFILGLPLYNYKECQNYIMKKLEKEGGFDVELYNEITIVIKWFPKNKNS